MTYKWDIPKLKKQAKAIKDYEDMNITKQLKILKEKLASIEHTRWADWQKWCHKILRENCSSPELEKVLERWDKQIATDYKDLSEKEKDSDRKQVDRYLPLLRQSLTEILDEVKGEYKIIGSRAHCLSCGGYKAADECFCAAHNARESELRERIKLLKK